MTEFSSGALRALRPDDLDRVVDIDRAGAGRSRRGFFEKRLQAAIAQPDAFIVVAAEGDGRADGFAIARIQAGEFGDHAPVAILDAIGVASDRRGDGLGRLLLDGVAARLAHKGIAGLRTQVGWSNQDLAGFFAACGFRLAPRVVLERPTAGELDAMEESDELEELPMDVDMPDYSGAEGSDFAALSRDRLPVRSLRAEDLGAVVAIDARLTGRHRDDYYRRKFTEVLAESGVRVSLVADVEGEPAGFVMARVDFGEFGRTEPTAVIDTIGIHPDHGGRGLGRALLSQLLANLATLQVETVRTTVRWNHFRLLGFLESCAFTPAQRLVLTRDSA